MSVDSDIREMKNDIRKLKDTLDKITGSYGALSKLDDKLRDNSSDIRDMKEDLQKLTKTDFWDYLKGAFFINMAQKIDTIEKAVSKDA